MKNETEPQDGTTTLTNPNSEIVGHRDVTLADSNSDSKKVFKFSQDPYTHKSLKNESLATLSNISVTIYRGQTPSGLYIVPDFNYRTYGWNFPYNFWILILRTQQGVNLETIRLNFQNADPACPARVVHFNYTYRAASDYFGACEMVYLVPNPPGSLITHC